MRNRATAVFVALALSSGCSAVGHRVDGVDWEQRWKDRTGEPVPEDVLTTFRGAEHCDWQSTVFLTLGWPPGTPAPNFALARMYVRDTGREFERLGYLRGRYDDDVELPRDARSTGYRLDGIELWLSPRDSASAIYVVRSDRVERWPRARSSIACA